MGSNRRRNGPSCRPTFANTIEGIIHGANRVDATYAGLGRGAGNCPIELLVSFLKNPKFDVRPLIEVIESEMMDWFAIGTQFHPECGAASALDIRIFEEFVQLKHHGARRKNRGSGLGLAIVAEVAHKHGGRAQVARLDEGTVFTMVLPLREETDDVDHTGG